MFEIKFLFEKIKYVSNGEGFHDNKMEPVKV